jgi:hypothetical protein
MKKSIVISHPRILAEWGIIFGWERFLTKFIDRLARRRERWKSISRDGGDRTKSSR